MRHTLAVLQPTSLAKTPTVDSALVEATGFLPLSYCLDEGRGVKMAAMHCQYPTQFALTGPSSTGSYKKAKPLDMKVALYVGDDDDKQQLRESTESTGRSGHQRDHQ